MTVIAASAPMTVARSNVAGGQTSRPVPYRAPDTHPEQFSDVIAVLTFHSRWRARGAMVADPPERQRSTQFTARGLHRICCFFDHAFADDLVDRGFRRTRWEMASPASRRSQSFGMVGESRNDVNGRIMWRSLIALFGAIEVRSALSLGCPAGP